MLTRNRKPQELPKGIWINPKSSSLDLQCTFRVCLFCTTLRITTCFFARGMKPSPPDPGPGASATASETYNADAKRVRV
ncbi:hypothetical protein F2Q70_00043928 [Brassica cretica]|uniref:Uncharacterized protein n=2 Tax=Brassica cretica TaxID=69181 RepID=A0A8S9KN19_BRACR|nr:hypothetical protein F2Q70_00043928 [Brassica cretica]KAF3518169.1 hypothetical protein DY000_02061423 [Brassica cretica]KAF3521349.1 hypothetical protein F2Q69_00049126 [Brassica cretica]